MWRVKVSWRDKEGNLHKEDTEKDSIEAALDSLQASICEEEDSLIEDDLLELHITRVMEPPEEKKEPAPAEDSLVGEAASGQPV